MKKNNKGFTLAELLIVVAIIAVLVAIAIPVFTTRLEQSRETTDIANLRSAYAAAQVAALAGDADGNTCEGVWTYDPNASVGIASGTVSGAYLGKGTATDGKADYTALPDVVKKLYSNTSDNRSKQIKVNFSNGVVDSVSFAG